MNVETNPVAPGDALGKFLITSLLFYVYVENMCVFVLLFCKFFQNNSIFDFHRSNLHIDLFGSVNYNILEQL